MSAESPNTEPPPSDSSSTDPLPPRLAVALFVPLLVYTAVTRLMALGLKPVQHDESMFAYYSHLMLDGKPYEFMPILHGPLLEWTTAGVFSLFGASDATMRLFPALCGIGIVVMVWGLRGATGRRAALLAVLFIALSPTLLFFSRFCRNDLPFLFTATVTLWGFVRYAQSGGAVPLFIALLAGATAVTIKETWLIFFFIQLAFLAACWIYSRVKRLSLNQAPAVGAVLPALRQRPFTMGLAASMGAVLIIALYSSFFHYPAHWDGVAESFQYWLEEHRSHRIEGPYHFYLIHLAIYELPLLVFWCGSLVYRFAQVDDAAEPMAGRQRSAFWSWVAVSAATLIVFWNRKLPDVFDDVAHMSLGLHVWMAAQLVLLVCIACWKHLNRGQTLHAFADCWTGASFVIFSYAGEKVPWVTAHIVLPMTLSCAMYADLGVSRWLAAANAPGRRSFLRRLSHWGGAGLATLSLGWLLWLSLLVSFINSGNPIERHTYAASHPEFHLAVKQVIHEAMKTPMGADTRIAFEGEVAWPLWWSLRNFELKTPEVYPGTYPPYVIVDQYAYDAAPAYRDDYIWQRVRFRHYWQPEPLDWSAMRRLDLLLRPNRVLSKEQQAVRKTAGNEWLKLAKAIFLRDENIQGPTRWDELGGLDAYIGRLKPEADGLGR